MAVGTELPDMEAKGCVIIAFETALGGGSRSVFLKVKIPKGSRDCPPCDMQTVAKPTKSPQKANKSGETANGGFWFWKYNERFCYPTVRAVGLNENFMIGKTAYRMALAALKDRRDESEIYRHSSGTEASFTEEVPLGHVYRARVNYEEEKPAAKAQADSKRKDCDVDDEEGPEPQKVELEEQTVQLKMEDRDIKPMLSPAPGASCGRADDGADTQKKQDQALAYEMAPMRRMTVVRT